MNHLEDIRMRYMWVGHQLVFQLFWIGLEDVKYRGEDMCIWDSGGEIWRKETISKTQA